MQKGRRVRLGFYADLNRLLQYLHGRVFGFCCRCSPFSSAVLGGGAVSMDWRGSMGEEASTLLAWGVCWGIGTGKVAWGRDEKKGGAEAGKGGEEVDQGSRVLWGVVSTLYKRRG